MDDRQLARTYAVEASEAEHARLIALARRSADQVREMCARVGVGPGARVIDVGCGPVGALLELAEIVGPQGTVVGVDSSAAAVETARAIAVQHGLDYVRVVHGDVNSMDTAALASDGPFDAAHVRFVLVHQADPAATLRRVAALVRPGGHLLLLDPVDDPGYPWLDPPVPASERTWEVLYATARRSGAAVDVARRSPRLWEEAGLRVIDARGAFRVVPPAQEWLEATRATLLSLRRAAVGFGLATDAEVDALAEALSAAQRQEFRSALGPLGVRTIAQVPEVP